jgi:hypothetical protein
MKHLIHAALIFVLLGCAGGPAATQAPDWATATPQPDAAYHYFTGAGTSGKNDQAQAEQTARGALIDEIMRYIGVKVTSETTAVARASIDSFKTDVMQSVTQTGSGRIAGLEIADKFVEKRSNGTTVYLLARYNKTDLAKEKKRIEDIFIEQQRAVSGPEEAARRLEAEGDYFAAVVKYIEAAAAAAKSDIDNAKIKFERNINSAKGALDRIGLVKLNDNLTTAAGTPFAEPFRLKVVAGATAGDHGIPDAALRASFTEIKGDRKQVKSVALKTDADGVASFTYPVPEFVGSERLTMALDIDAYLETLRGLPKDLSVMIGGLEDSAVSKRAVFVLTTVSKAREVETGIAVVALDESGNPIAGTDFASGIMKSLSDARFSVKVLPLDAAGITGRQDADVIGAAAKAAAVKTGRVIFGTAEFGGSEIDGGNVFVRVSGTVKVADLKTGAILLTVTRNKQALGKNAAAALAAAFRQLGQDIGQEIANKLR